MNLRLSFFVLLLATQPLRGQEWPQWQGPNRDNVSLEKGLLSAWPEKGPELLWHVDDLGGGYSTPTIAQGKLFGLSYQGDDEVIWGRALKDGRLLWSEKLAQANREVDYKEGSRSSPTVDGDLLYALGVSGDLVCVGKDGGIRWQRNLIKEFEGILPYYRETYGYTESPLIDGDKVVVTPGGEKHTVIALDKKTGKHIWSASVPRKRFKGDNRAAYSSLVAGEVGGVRQYVQFLQGCVVGVSSAGKLLWRWDKPSNDIANCTTPIFKGDLVFASSGYGKGCGLGRIEVKKEGVELAEQWFNKGMKNVHGGIVLAGGHVYGNSDPGMLVCVELATGKAKWQERMAGKGAILYADGRLYYRDEEGPMVLVEANPEKYVETGRFSPPFRSKVRAWAHPVVAGGRMYLRDQGFLLCYDVKGKE